MSRPPRTYDEIVARTVPEPDSSFRPTPEQLEDTREGHVLPTDDEQLAERVIQVLERAGATGIKVEVEGARATLRGAMPDIETLNRIEDLARTVPGIERIENRMHVEVPRA
ncbi:MAG TPA: BON domain-containing protein [Kofleriaceae bacterium]|nr:BON domain-containing protein [Kofleriaceae bacterium]